MFIDEDLERVGAAAVVGADLNKTKALLVGEKAEKNSFERGGGKVPEVVRSGVVGAHAEESDAIQQPGKGASKEGHSSVYG